MRKPGYVSTDKTGTNKKGGAKDSMPGFENFAAYNGTNEEAYQQDAPPPAKLQDNPDVKKASINVLPDRYY